MTAVPRRLVVVVVDMSLKSHANLSACHRPRRCISVQVPSELFGIARAKQCERYGTVTSVGRRRLSKAAKGAITQSGASGRMCPPKQHFGMLTARKKDSR